MRATTSKQLRKVAELVYIKTIAPIRRELLEQQLPIEELRVKLAELRTPKQVYKMVKKQYKRFARG